jgi:transposase-like protein
VKRQYTDAEKASALALLQANAGNVTRTCRDLGIPAATLRDWRDGEGVNHAVAEIREGKIEELDTLFEQVARLYLGQAMTKEVISRASGKDAVIAAATATDKMRLLQNKPTAINSNDLRIDLSKLNDQQLHQLDAILAAAGLPPPD